MIPTAKKCIDGREHEWRALPRSEYLWCLRCGTVADPDHSPDFPTCHKKPDTNSAQISNRLVDGGKEKE